MRRTPAPIARSGPSSARPICPLRSTWVPPHSSRAQSPKATTRTRSPYFSSKSATAPAAPPPPPRPRPPLAPPRGPPPPPGAPRPPAPPPPAAPGQPSAVRRLPAALGVKRCLRKEEVRELGLAGDLEDLGDHRVG